MRVCLHGLCALMLELLVRCLHGVLLCSDAGAIVWVCDRLHWMLNTLMCSNAGALVGHVRVPAWGVKYVAVLCWSCCLGM